MTMYYAAVKYALDASESEKIRALKEGIESCAMALVSEFGLSMDDVREALDDAALTAEWCYEEAHADDE